MAAAALSLAISSPARAASGVRVALEARSITSLVSDGARFVYYKARPDTVVVRDDQRETRRRFLVPNRCRPVAAYPGMGLLDCQDSPPTSRPVLLDPRNGNPFWFAVTAADADLYDAIGRHWMAGARCASAGGHCATVYRNWRTGEWRTRPYVADLDTADLSPRGRSSADWATIGRAGILKLVHRGARRTISDCRLSCELESVGGGIVTWVEGPRSGSLRRVLRYSVRSGRRWDRRLRPRSVRRPVLRGVVHTRTRVYVTVMAGSRQRLYRLAY
jgi:hypothetical protein